MKKWVEKLIEQFDFEWNEDGKPAQVSQSMSEDRATLLYIIDTYNKHLLEVTGHPVRKVRETLDDFAKEILNNSTGSLEKVMFRFRQFFSAYRIDECAYFQKTYEDFRTIIWDFIDQLAEDMSVEQREDDEIRSSLDELKEAVESHSIDVLKNQSRKFIDCYMEKQFKKQKRTANRMKSIRKNLSAVKKQLNEASDQARTDHLTGAYNRKSFDEHCRENVHLFKVDQHPVTMLLLDIDHFKRINDTYGHPIGDFVLKELVKTVRGLFHRETDFLARIGGEEFAIILPDYQLDHAVQKAEEILNKVRAEVFVHEDHQIRFTVSIGIAQLTPGETPENWLKRADWALYHSKHNGRNRYTVALNSVPTAA